MTVPVKVPFPPATRVSVRSAGDVGDLCKVGSGVARLMPIIALLLLASCTTRPGPVEGGHAVRTGESLEGSVDPVRGEALVSFRGRRVLAYAFAAGQFKPYVRELYSLRGENVLLDSPPDHLHHHGLMLALRVNGVNFWEERPPAGRQVSAQPPGLAFRVSASGFPEAVITHEIRWHASDESDPGTALLREHRELVVTVNPGAEEIGVEWRSAFETGACADTFVLHGPDYHGLGLRLPAEFDHVAEFSNSSRLAYSEGQTFDVRPAAWSAVAGKMGGREVQVALALHPSNPGKHAFFSMRNAFAYLAATPEPSRGPLEFRRGERFEFRHLLLVYPARQNAEYLDRRFAPWLAGPK